MIFDLLGILDDITGNVVSETIERSEYSSRQRILNQPANRLAQRKMYLASKIKEYNSVLDEYKECQTLVEMYSRWKKECIEELELIR